VCVCVCVHDGLMFTFHAKLGKFGWMTGVVLYCLYGPAMNLTSHTFDMTTIN